MADFDHSHITPAGYLKSWAIGRQLAMRLVEAPDRVVLIAPKDAGVRRGFTRERQPDGTYVNRLDPMLAKLEDVALPLWRNLDEHWPATGNTRSAIAELIAFQVVRSPAWRDFHNVAVPKQRASVREKYPGLHDRHFEAAEATLLSDESRHDRLRMQGRLLTFVIANMHWTLLQADGPLLVTSDHPVVALALDVDATSAPNAIPVGGLVNTLELRFAARPDLLLVMSWRDVGEDRGPRPLSEQHIRNHNSLVIAQAERQWFHHREITPVYDTQTHPAIAPELHPGYGASGAAVSQRRAWVSQLLSDPIDYKRFAETIPYLPWPAREAA
ncbi:MAG TPA: DUF4238 domain-containing protein [Solirubrobacteraceae bacterium]|jgi:hypothetical protein